MVIINCRMGMGDTENLLRKWGVSTSLTDHSCYNRATSFTLRVVNCNRIKGLRFKYYLDVILPLLCCNKISLRSPTSTSFFLTVATIESKYFNVSFCRMIYFLQKTMKQYNIKIFFFLFFYICKSIYKT